MMLPEKRMSVKFITKDQSINQENKRTRPTLKCLQSKHDNKEKANDRSFFYFFSNETILI